MSTIPTMPLTESTSGLNEHEKLTYSNLIDERMAELLLLHENEEVRARARSRLPSWSFRKFLLGASFALLASLYIQKTLLSFLGLGFHSERLWNPIWAQLQLLYQCRIVHVPSDFLEGVTPLQCHSHNDYQRRIPLFEALQAGCSSIEADVWLHDDKGLLVGHDIQDLQYGKTLESMYIGPLVSILDQRNRGVSGNATKRGVFLENPAWPLVLLVDIKSNGVDTLQVLEQQLEPLRSRGYLTRYDGTAVIPGPVMVVGSGNTPFDLIAERGAGRDVFFDAPLFVIEDAYFSHSNPAYTRAFNTTNSYFASASYTQTLNQDWPCMWAPTREQRGRMARQVEAAHALGLKVRYWGTPSWPGPLRNVFWRAQDQLGVDVINVDHVQAFASGAWRSRPSSDNDEMN